MEDDSQQDIVLYKSPIAEPMATDKLSEKLMTLVKKCNPIHF